MSSRHRDPLVQPHDPDRVNYANGVLLDEKDFREEQTYSRSRLARALGYLHGHGTVAGLDVGVVTTGVRDEGGIVEDAHVLRVSAGLAIDRLGRLIEVPVPYCVRAQKWFEAEVKRDPEAVAQSLANGTDGALPEAVVADLYLGFEVCARGATPAFGIGNVDATDAFIAHRLRDGSHLRLVLRTEGDKDPVTQRPPLLELPDIDPDNPRTVPDALDAIRDAKLQHGWNETARWNVADNKLLLGPEYAVDQEGTEVLLARVRLPAAGDPPEYDVQGEIEVDNAVRVLSYTTFELSWLLRAT